jgi:hypothetical protein
MKKIVWLFIDKKTHLLVVMDFWNQKIWTGHLIGTSQNEKIYQFTFQIFNWDSIYNVI